MDRNILVINMDWAIKHAPKSPDDYAGSKNAVRIVSNFLDRWEERNQLKNGLILYGEPGNGKTSLIYALSGIYKLNIIEINSSNKRNASDLIGLVSLSGTNSFDGKTTVILLDEADGIAAWKPIEDLLTRTQCPIFMTCNDLDAIPYDISKECFLVEVLYPTNIEIVKRLRQITRLEGKKVTDEELNEISLNCNSMRNAILTLQRCATSGKFTRIVAQDTDYNEAQQIRMLFSGKDFNLTLDAKTVRKWAIANGINIHKLDRIIKLSYEEEGMTDILHAYLKTLRGDVSRLKSPYYTPFFKKKEFKREDKKEFVFKEQERHEKEVETVQVMEHSTFEDDNLW
jgi:DNA polymerase III delta prime subunit